MVWPGFSSWKPPVWRWFPPAFCLRSSPSRADGVWPRAASAQMDGLEESCSEKQWFIGSWFSYMAMGQNLWYHIWVNIIYHLFWCSLGYHGFDPWSIGDCDDRNSTTTFLAATSAPRRRRLPSEGPRDGFTESVMNAVLGWKNRLRAIQINSTCAKSIIFNQHIIIITIFLKNKKIFRYRNY